jgi:hypothetical protein
MYSLLAILPIIFIVALLLSIPGLGNENSVLSVLFLGLILGVALTISFSMAWIHIKKLIVKKDNRKKHSP